MILFEEIQRLLPQKYPFLFIDKVVAFEEGKKIVCVKNVSGKEAASTKERFGGIGRHCPPGAQQ